MTKRIWILAVFVMLGFAQKAESKSINTLNICIAPGETRECYIYMETARTNVIAFQMDLKLPAGLKLNTENCKLTSRVKDTEQILFAGSLSPNTYRLLSTSFNAVPFTREKDTFVKLSLTADETFKGGTVTLTNMQFITSTSSCVSLSSDSFTVTAKPKMTGDVDFNGVVNVTDPMYIVDYILDSNKIYTSAMDVNSDGIIDITDAMTVVDQILFR